MPLLTVTMLLLLVLAAALYDLWEWRIPNTLIIAGFISGIFSTLILKGTMALPQMLLGAALPLLLPGILFFFRMIGAGDIKLLSMIGTFLGPSGIWRVIWLTFLFGAAVSVIKLLRRRTLLLRFVHLAGYTRHFLMTWEHEDYIKLTVSDHAQGGDLSAACLSGTGQTSEIAGDPSPAGDMDRLSAGLTAAKDIAGRNATQGDEPGTEDARVHLAVCILAGLAVYLLLPFG